MVCPPFVTRWFDGLCFWLLLSNDGKHIVSQSPSGFYSEEDAKADFIWRHAI